MWTWRCRVGWCFSVRTLGPPSSAEWLLCNKCPPPGLPSLRKESGVSANGKLTRNTYANRRLVSAAAELMALSWNNAGNFPRRCFAVTDRPALGQVVLREALSNQTCFLKGHPGSNIPLILQDLRRILTRTYCKSLQETYKIASKTPSKTSNKIPRRNSCHGSSKIL